MVPVVDDDPMAPSALPTPDSYEWFTATAEKRAPSWRNEVTLRSLEYFRGYEPIDYVPKISPTPLLMVVAPGDRLVDGGLSLRAYEAAVAPEEARHRRRWALRRLHRRRLRDLVRRGARLVRRAPRRPAGGVTVRFCFPRSRP